MNAGFSSADRKYTMLVLVAVIIVCALMLYTIDWLTREKIEINTRDHQFRIIKQVLHLPYDNAILEDVIEITDPGYFPSGKPVKIFRARNRNQPVALILMPVTARGYSGHIQLLIGIDYDGRILSVRAMHHSETEGFGDQIELSNSSWILSFDNLSLVDTNQENWLVRSDGGTFDEMSGATITSRGIINAVHKTLEYIQANRDKLYEQE